MKKVFSIVFLMLFITIVIIISKFSQTRSLVEAHREHTEQIDCGKKLSTQFDNFNLLSVDENKSESEIFTFDCDLFVRFLTIYFHQTFYQKNCIRSFRKGFTRRCDFKCKFSENG